MKERFEATEWAHLQALPIHLFAAIAIADGEIQKEEIEEFVRRLTIGAHGYKDPLHRELARSIVDADILKVLKRKDAGGFKPDKTKQVLKEKLTSEEYQKFVGSLFIDAFNIAAASKTGLFRKKAISAEEHERLTAIAIFWEVELERIVASTASAT
ncbi:MAG: hypothetical protein HKM89_04860 [Gemmatimonadales bacterium]|nr:hypothetical protein [Gemmatimonadales bacterium]